MPAPGVWPRAGSQETTSSPDPATGKLITDWVGKRWSLFKLAIWTSLLTILTLGLYRFWMKTRLRRYYWSSIKPGGVPLEYTGDPLEKLLGFLIAVTFLAFYIGIVNLILMFGSFALFSGNVTGYILSFVGVIPFYFYAQYRARRYVLARTRWRGIRFGLEPGAWGYAWRAMGHMVLTIITLGILWPRMTFWLEKYRTDRTFFGDHRLHQDGRWQMLWRKVWMMLIPLGVSVVGFAMIGNENNSGFGVLAIAAIWFPVGWVYYRVATFRLLTKKKRLGAIYFAAEPRTTRVVGIYMLGSLIVGLIILVFAFAAVFAFAFLLSGADIGGDWIDALENSGSEAINAVTIFFSILIYFAFMLLWGALAQAFITFPRLQHYAKTFAVVGAGHLPTISQRNRDEFAEAEGFAEALDVGAAL